MQRTWPQAGAQNAAVRRPQGLPKRCVTQLHKAANLFPSRAFLCLPIYLGRQATTAGSLAHRTLGFVEINKAGKRSHPAPAIPSTPVEKRATIRKAIPAMQAAKQARLLRGPRQCCTLNRRAVPMRAVASDVCLSSVITPCEQTSVTKGGASGLQVGAHWGRAGSCARSQRGFVRVWRRAALLPAAAAASAWLRGAARRQSAPLSTFSIAAVAYRLEPPHIRRAPPARRRARRGRHNLPWWLSPRLHASRRLPPQPTPCAHCHASPTPTQDPVLRAKIKAHAASLTAALVVVDGPGIKEIATASLDKTLATWRIEVGVVCVGGYCPAAGGASLSEHAAAAAAASACALDAPTRPKRPPIQPKPPNSPTSSTRPSRCSAPRSLARPSSRSRRRRTQLRPAAARRPPAAAPRPAAAPTAAAAAAAARCGAGWRPRRLPAGSRAAAR